MTGSTARRLAVVLAILAHPLLPREGPAQEPALPLPDLPRQTAEEIVSFYNDPSTVRFAGRVRIPASAVIQAPVATLGGPLLVAGRIEGDLVVINGDLRLEVGARVTGGVVVVGGRLLEGTSDAVEGPVRIYEPPLPYTFRGDGIAFLDRTRRDGVSSPLGFGRSRFTVQAGDNYNRVEGLPVIFGPILETESRNPLRLEALGIWRSQAGFVSDPGEFGYLARLEQSAGGRDELALGLTAFSRVEPLERWGISDLEASLATFLLRRDYRDYRDESGWSVYAQFRPRRLPLRGVVEYLDREVTSTTPGAPWSLMDNDQPWRPLPVLGEGRLRTLGAGLTVDTRNDPRHPTSGWLGEGRLLLPVGGELTYPALGTEGDSDPEEEGGYGVPRAVPEGYRVGFLDLRRYDRVGPGSSIALRLLTGGALNRTPLPSQFQLAAGGEGSLPGHPLFELDCGARTTRRLLPERRGDGAAGGVPAFPGYGCDRLALVQAEFRSLLPLNLDPDGRLAEALAAVDLTPGWTLFLNAARGWSLSDGGVGGSFPGEPSGTLSDLGAGIYLGELGAYLAFPLQGERNRPAFFVRLTHRF